MFLRLKDMEVQSCENYRLVLVHTQISRKNWEASAISFFEGCSIFYPQYVIQDKWAGK